MQKDKLNAVQSEASPQHVVAMQVNAVGPHRTLNNGMHFEYAQSKCHGPAFE